MNEIETMTVKWTVDGESFQFVAEGDPPTLRLTDGRTVELTVRAWIALADVLGLLSPFMASRRNPEVRVVEPANVPPVEIVRTRRGLPWTDAEESRATEAYRAGDDVADIARALDRSRGAVLARLVVLGLIDEAEAGLRYPPKPTKTAKRSPVERGDEPIPY